MNTKKCFRFFSFFTAVLSICFINTGFSAYGDWFIPSRSDSLRSSGITLSSHPDGTGSEVRFNLFRNMTSVATIRNQSIADNTQIDERDFVTAYGGFAFNQPFQHSVNNLNLGDIVTVQVYVHNNAKQTCSSGNKATNTSVELNWSNPRELVASISANNAIPQTVSDKVSFSFSGGGDYSFIPANEITVGQRNHPNYGLPGCSSGDGSFSFSDHTAIKTNLTTSINLGDIPGSNGNVKIVYFFLQVVPAQHSLEITKSATPPANTTTDAGSNINYSLTVTNTGNVGLQNVTLTDTLDQNLQYISGGSANGQTVTFNFQNINTTPQTLGLIAQVRSNTPNGSQICNSATASGNGMSTVSSNQICHTINNDNGENQCGNGTINPGEQCDDGNPNSGDGCSTTCQIEASNPVCGNNIIETGEQCDDGNTISGDGCSDICNIEPLNAVCGNGVWEQGESCDDGNTSSGDGCDSTCQRESVCGNEILETNETCDDGNTISGDGCSDICNIEPLNAVCGNGVWEQGESCDDGNTSSGDGCDSTCQRESVCGNEILETNETCDDGNTISGDGCSDSCNIEPLSAVCGNGVWEQGESCDDGNISSGDGCDSTCQRESVCGNEILETNETCDDGNTISGDGCSDICNIEPLNAVCGNGVWEQGESCDDGNTSSGDGCDSTCQRESVCGNGAWEQGEQCDDGGNQPGDGCNATCQNEFCGNSIIDSGEGCDDGNTASGDGCSASCQIETSNPICGNNTTESGEQCDDGNNTPGDGCNSTCQSEICGNNIVDSGEGCDDGNSASGDGCSAFCQVETISPICGNNVLEANEQCDDGNTLSEDGCSASCTNENNSGGNNGSARLNQTIGTCTVHPSTGALQCTPRYPLEDTDDPDWQNYRNCRNDSSQTIRECLLEWTNTKGYIACGDTYPTTGEMMIPYTGSSDADLVAQCNDTPPIINGGEPCDEITGAISKSIKHVNDSAWHDDEAFIQKGDFVDYRVSVNFDATPYISSTGNVTSGTISIYDYTDYLGTSNPPIWERAGIVSEGWENWIAGGIKHEKPLTPGQITVINATGQFTKTLRYRAHTNLMSDQDVFTIGNDAFAMLRLRIDTIDPLSGATTTNYQQLAAGDNLCTIGAITNGSGMSSGVDIAEGTLGDDATAHIIRPFVEVRGGDAAFRFSDSTTSSTQRVTGDAAAITGDTLSSGSVYVESTTPSHLSDFSDNTSFSSLADFEEFSGTANADAFFANLKNNLSPVSENINGITNAQFSTTLGETNVYFINTTGTPTVTGNLDMNGNSKTFVIDNGEDLIINSNFTITNGYAAFIVRNGGNIIIDKDVTEIEGIFIAEGSEITTSVDPTNWQFEQSYYQLTVSGMLVGDMRNLFSYRKFIGVSLMTLNDLQPNVLLLFDLRLLLATPPALEKVLGEGWRQDIEIE